MVAELLHFLKEYEKIDGELAITPNMHPHLHLKDCVENYDSIYRVWLFSCEWYNGILGSYHTIKCNKTIEIEIMHKFVTSGILAIMPYNPPEDYKNFFLLKCKGQIESKGISGGTLRPPQLMMASLGPLLEQYLLTDLMSICFES